MTRAALAFAMLLMVSHGVLPDGHFVLSTWHALTPYWAVMVPLLALPAAWQHRRAAEGVGLAVAVGFAAWCWRPGLAATALPAADDLRVLTANVLYVNPQARALRDELLAHDADLLVLTEFTPEWQALMADAPYPYRYEDPQEHSFGTGVYSRFPLVNLTFEDLEGVPITHFDQPVGGRMVHMIAVHTLPPRTLELTLTWHAQLAALVAATSGEEDLMLLGDLNATRHHPSLRRLLRHSRLTDALTHDGHGHLPTWPNGLFLVPPLRLDHVLTRGVLVVESGLLPGVGSDHRPVWARVQ